MHLGKKNHTFNFFNKKKLYSLTMPHKEGSKIQKTANTLGTDVSIMHTVSYGVRTELNRNHIKESNSIIY